MKTGYDLDPHSASANAAQADYVARSNAAAALPGALLDVPYGAHARQKLDLFPAGPDAPVLVFFHGGYWRAGSKETRRFPALAWKPRGVSWVCVNYRLLPDVTLADTTQDARDSVRWLADHGASHGLDPARLHLAGNSAGGHLAAMAGAANWEGRPAIASLTLISGLFDLAPVRDTSANEWLNLDAAAVQALSPRHHLPPPDVPLCIGYGGDETDVFEQQSSGFAKACQANGSEVDLFESAGKDHFQIISEFGTPDTPIFDRLQRLLNERTDVK